MPKRKRKHDDNEKLEFLEWKVKKLEQKMGRRGRSKSKRHHRRDRSRSRSRRSQNPRDYASSAEHDCDPSDITVEEILATSDEATGVDIQNEEHSTESGLPSGPPANQTAPTENKNDNVSEHIDETPILDEVDNDLLEILGTDPSATVEYGKDIHSELASRLQHIATAGLTKEARKELNEKYLLPSNCVKIGAPSMNPEIKAAVPETVMKRDKGIEARQKQLSSAISCLAGVLSNEIAIKDKDSARSKQLMDVCRILCDIQHAESVTRRNFATFSIKKELKEHIVGTKIDKSLFGEDLADTLKSAKAVTKSGSELKTKPPPKSKPSTSVPNLNWKSPAPARKQQPPSRGGREAAHPPAPGPAARSYRSTTHAGSSKPSQRPSKQTRRR